MVGETIPTSERILSNIAQMWSSKLGRHLVEVKGNTCPHRDGDRDGNSS